MSEGNPGGEWTLNVEGNPTYRTPEDNARDDRAGQQIRSAVGALMSQSANNHGRLDLDEYGDPIVRSPEYNAQVEEVRGQVISATTQIVQNFYSSSNSHENSSPSSSGKSSEPSISQATEEYAETSKQQVISNTNIQDFTDAITEADMQIANLQTRAQVLVERINNKTTTNQARDLGELRYLLGADYKGGPVYGTKGENGKWVNETTGKEISGELYKLQYDRNNLAKLTGIEQTKLQKLDEVAVRNERRLTAAFGRSYASRELGEADIQSALRIYHLRPRYRTTKQELAEIAKIAAKDARAEEAKVALLDELIYEDFGPTVEMIAVAQGVDKKFLNKTVSDVNRHIIDGVFHLAKETAILYAGGTVARLAAVSIAAEAPMTVKALNWIADFALAPKVESLEWLAGRIGRNGLVSELEALSVSAAKTAFETEIKLAKLITGERGVQVLLEEATNALRTSKLAFEQIADKSSPEALVAYKKYKTDYELSKIYVKETRSIEGVQSLAEKKALFTEVQLAEKSIYDSARTTLEIKAVERGLESAKPLAEVNAIATAPASRFTLSSGLGSARHGPGGPFSGRGGPFSGRRGLGGNRQQQNFSRYRTDEEIQLTAEYNQRVRNTEEAIKSGDQALIQLQKEKQNAAYIRLSEKLDLRLSPRAKSLIEQTQSQFNATTETHRGLRKIRGSTGTLEEKRRAVQKLTSTQCTPAELEGILSAKTLRAFKKAVRELESVLQQRNAHRLKYEMFIRQLELAIDVSRTKQCDLSNFFITLKSMRGGAGGRGQVNTFIRDFMGGKPGEHPYTVEEFIEAIFNGMFQGHVPSYNDAKILASALKDSVKELAPNVNAAYNSLYQKAAHPEFAAFSYEERFTAAFEKLTEAEQNAIATVGNRPPLQPGVNTAAERTAKINSALSAIHETRENAAADIISYIIKENNNLNPKSDYLIGFVENQLEKWEGKAASRRIIEEKIKTKLETVHNIHNGTRALELYLPRPAATQAVSRLVPHSVGQSVTATPFASRLQRAVGQQPPRGSRGLATSVPRPADARFSIPNILEIKTGPALKSLVPSNLHKTLGLDKPNLRVSVIKEIVFRYLSSEGKIQAAQAWELQLTRVRLAIAAKNTEKASAAKTAALEVLRKEEAELISKHGNITPAVRASDNVAHVLGDDVAAVDEQAMYSWASKAPESKAAVHAVEDVAEMSGKGTTEKILHKTNATAEQANNAKKSSTLGDTKIERDSEAMSATASSSANEVVLEREALTAGKSLPSEVKIPGSTPAQVSSATDEATSVYTRVFGKADNPPLVSKTVLDQAAAEEAEAAALLARRQRPPEAQFPAIVPSNNATSLIDLIKAYTPYGMSLRRLKTALEIGAKNVRTFGVLARNLALEGRSIAAYNEFIEESLKVILEHASYKQVGKLITVFTPQRLIEFKEAMTSLFSYSHTHATRVLNIMLTKIIPGSKYNEALIDGLIQIMRNNPSEALAEINKLAAQVMAQEIITGAATSQAAAKGAGWFKIKSYYSLLLAGGGASVLFLANLANTPDLKTFSEKVSDKGEDLKRQLEQNPSYKEMQEISRKIRERILVDILGQVPPPPAEPAEPKREEWTDSLMRSLGYNPDKAEDRRKFASMAETVRNTAAAAAAAAATAAAAALAKAAVSATVGR